MSVFIGRWNDIQGRIGGQRPVDVLLRVGSSVENIFRKLSGPFPRNAAFVQLNRLIPDSQDPGGAILSQKNRISVVDSRVNNTDNRIFSLRVQGRLAEGGQNAGAFHA